MEALTPDEIEAFRARVAAQAGAAPNTAPVDDELPAALRAMEAAALDAEQIAARERDFYGDWGVNGGWQSPPLVQGIIFDFDNTLAQLERPLAALMEEGARAANEYMRSTGMDLEEDFWRNLIEARVFSEGKSEEEVEEHIADDALSFLLQFFGYPASAMRPDVLRRAVDIFYAPEMTAWRVPAAVHETLTALRDEGFKLALIANYNCDRVFQRTIDYAGLRPYFDIVVCSASVEYRKPDVKIFELVTERWDALPHELIIIGDSLVHDIAGGLELGALTVQTTQFPNERIAFDNAQVAAEVTPDATIASLSELLALVREWAT